MLTTATTVKVFIDVFIGVWAFVLALIWVYGIDRASPARRCPLGEIWQRFPKFVLGYLVLVPARAAGVVAGPRPEPGSTRPEGGDGRERTCSAASSSP